jgi:hypothetical protein
MSNFVVTADLVALMPLAATIEASHNLSHHNTKHVGTLCSPLRLLMTKVDVGPRSRRGRTVAAKFAACGWRAVKCCKQTRSCSLLVTQRATCTSIWRNWTFP